MSNKVFITLVSCRVVDTSFTIRVLASRTGCNTDLIRDELGANSNTTKLWLVNKVLI